MTPLPKRKLSTQRQGKRRASFKLKAETLLLCKNCSKTITPHTICDGCGYYGGKQMKTIKAKKDKKV